MCVSLHPEGESPSPPLKPGLACDALSPMESSRSDSASCRARLVKPNGFCSALLDAGSHAAEKFWFSH